MNQMQLHQYFQEKQSTASHSSKEFKKKQQNAESLSLIKNIQRLENKNQIKYESILKNNPQFFMKLYKAPSLLSSSKLTFFNQQLLLKQLDNLMEDQYLLDKELNKINFQLQQDEKQKQLQIYNNMNHYQFLRSVWTSQPIDLPYQDKLQTINKKIGFIKGHIKILISKEQQESQHQDIKEIIQSTQEYQRVKQKLEQHQMHEEDTRQSVYEVEKRKDQIIIEELRQQNETLRAKNKEEKEKSRKLEHQIIELKMKIHEIEKSLIDKDKELSKVKRQAKHIYEKKDDFTLILFSNSIREHQKFSINKTFNELHEFLIEQKTKSEEKRQHEPLEKNQLREEALRTRKLYHFKNEKNPTKVRHIKGVNDLKSLEGKKPKFMRSSTLFQEFKDN